jgi:hypothetical protein
MADPVKNFAKCPVSGGYSSTDTVITLQAGEGTKLPNPIADGAFNLVWWDYSDYPDPSGDPNVEIVRCTARTDDIITVARHQEDTTASAKNLSGKTYMVALSFTAGLYGDVSQADKSETLTNKTIDADDNTISNLETDNFKSGVIDTDDTLSSDSDTKIPTQKAVKTYVDDNTPDPTKLVDSNGVDSVLTVATASAVNEVTVTNAATGGVPKISATGDDTNIHLDLRGKGNALVKISVLRQDNTTNTYIPSSVVLVGRKPITISSGQAAQNVDVTFGITFSLAPIVIAVSSTHSDTFASLAEEAVVGVNGTPGTSSFSLRMLTRSGTVSANRACQADWIAIGTL